MKNTQAVIALTVLLLCAGCIRSNAGPAQLVIETDNKAYDDYVIRSAEKFSTLHGGHADIGIWVVVSSNSTVEIALSEDQPPNLTSFSVDTVHPAFRFTWTARSVPPGGGPFDLPRIVPTQWSEHLLGSDSVDYTTINDHLYRVLMHWVPTFGVEAGARLRAYMPLIQQLVMSAGWTRKDASNYDSEEEARAQMTAQFEALQRLAE